MTTLDRKLAAHRDALAACRRCGHRGDIQPIVSLARSPKAMLVGQAPGKTEAAGGKPFAGRAGKTLFSWLAAAGIDEATARSRLYIAAVTRCYPGPSPSGRGDRVPNPTERATCAAWLDSELRIIQPSLIIPVGRLAITAFLGDRPLEEIIGREFSLARPPGETSADPARVQRAVPVDAVAIPLPHPSGASSWIHAPGHRKLLLTALSRIASRWSALMRGRRAA